MASRAIASASRSIIGRPGQHASAAVQALKTHWPEYLIEAAALGFFMVSACTFGVLLEHPSSPFHPAIPNPVLRRLLMGLAMGLTAVTIIYSPWGKQSGAHMNPSITLTFYVLGKIEQWDAAFYGLAQFAGGVLGVLIASAVWRTAVAEPHVNYVVTVPGAGGAKGAFLGEVCISFLLMLVVLLVSNREKLAPFTGLIAGCLVATYITVEAPLSGMSMNPARSFGSAFAAGEWRALWIYFTAPPLGMLLAAVPYRGWRGPHAVFCAKLHHQNDKRCIFRCNYEQMGA